MFSVCGIIFSKFFSPQDREAVLNGIALKSDPPYVEVERVVFLDTPPTPQLVETIRQLKTDGIEVIVRDHHDVDGHPRTDRERAIRAAVEEIRGLAGDAAVISNRREHPACASLIEAQEFYEVGTVIVADPDPDGLTAAMKAVGVTYPEMDTDAAVLDGPRSQQTAEGGLSPLAVLLVKGLATLPPFNPRNPSAVEEAKMKLFADFFSVVADGDDAADALSSLEDRAKEYEATVAEAEKLAAEATEPASGVWLVDAVAKPRFNLQTLSECLENRDGCRVTVVRKDTGPIAAVHSVQYSLAVPRALQNEVNLQAFLPEGFTSSPEVGLISNTTFLLHCSEQVWDEIVLLALLRTGDGCNCGSEAHPCAPHDPVIGDGEFCG